MMTRPNIVVIRILLVLILISVIIPLGGVGPAGLRFSLCIGGFIAALSIAEKGRVLISVGGALAILVVPYLREPNALGRVLKVSVSLGVFLTVIALFHLALVRRRSD